MKVKFFRVIVIGFFVLFSFRAVTRSAETKCKSKEECYKQYSKKGKAYFDKEDYENAIIYFLKALNEKPNATVVMTYLGICYCKTDKVEDSVDLLEKVVEIAPDKPEAEIANQWLPICKPPPEPPRCPGPEVNICLNKPVEDLWTRFSSQNSWKTGWLDNGCDASSINDGDFSTGLYTGYGEWDGGTRDVQTAFSAADARGEGIPGIEIDLSLDNACELGKIVFGRQLQQAGEGAHGAIMSMSIWVSEDGQNWEMLIDPFTVMPNSRETFDLNSFKTDKAARFLRVNFHGLGLYKWKKKTNSQMGFSEVQCFARPME